MARSRRPSVPLVIHTAQKGFRACSERRSARNAWSRYNSVRVQLRDHIRESLRLVETHQNLLETTPPDVFLQTPAAGLMRCCELLRGMCVLEDAGLGTLVGMLERQLWETWLISLDILLRDTEALVELGHDYDHHMNALIKGLGLPSEEYPDFGKSAQRNIRDLFEKIEARLVEAGDTFGARLIKDTYFNVYRRNSHLAVHAGVGTLSAYIRIGETSLSVEPNPADTIGSAWMSLFWTLHLAKYVFGHFGIESEAIDQAVRNAIRDAIETFKVADPRDRHSSLQTRSQQPKRQP